MTFSTALQRSKARYFSAVREAGYGPTQPRQSSDFVSAMRGITAAPTHCRRGGS